MQKKKFFLILIMGIVGFAQLSTAEEKTITSDEIPAIRTKAEKGDSEAQVQLGDAYQKGEGVRQDDMQAARWYQEAANQGNADGQYALGFAYRGGFGVSKDEILAYMWFDLAATRGNEEALDMRSAVAELMTYEQISEARQKSHEWKPNLTEKKPETY